MFSLYLTAQDLSNLLISISAACVFSWFQSCDSLCRHKYKNVLDAGGSQPPHSKVSRRWYKCTLSLHSLCCPLQYVPLCSCTSSVLCHSAFSYASHYLRLSRSNSHCPFVPSPFAGLCARAATVARSVDRHCSSPVPTSHCCPVLCHTLTAEVT